MFDSNKGFYNFNQYVDESYMDLTSQNGTYNIQYPINFLEDALGGMIKSELLVIGADSGCGKSEIVNKIAFYNAQRKKNVYMFSLEGDKYDLVHRLRYGAYVTEFNKRYERYCCGYRDFLINKDINPEILKIAESKIKDKLQTLYVYKRESDLTLELFEAYLDRVSHKADVLIIDHLHYFDFHKKEYEAINDIMKQLKKLQEKYRIPMILVSHLRKKDKTRSFPDQADFHGSSNIVKQSDTCVVLGHMDVEEKDQAITGLYQTGIRIVKSRTGFPQKIVGSVEYNLQTRQYSEEYQLYICGTNYIEKLETIPGWAKNARYSSDDKKGKTQRMLS